MSRNTAEREGVLIMHFALDGVAARGRHLGWSDAIADGIGGIVKRVVHPQRTKDAFGEEVVDTLTGDGFHHPAQYVGAEVAVDVAGPWLARQRRLEDDALGLVNRRCHAP